MIEKIDHSMRTRTLKTPLARHPLFYHMLYDVHADWNMLWWIGCAGVWLEDRRRACYESVSEALDHFEKLSSDVDATFPFKLEPGQTRVSRYCAEAASHVEEFLAREQKLRKAKNQPRFFEMFFMKLKPETLQLEFAYSTLPLIVESSNQSITLGQFTFDGKAVCDVPRTALAPGPHLIALHGPLPWEPKIEIFKWNVLPSGNESTNS